MSRRPGLPPVRRAALILALGLVAGTAAGLPFWVSAPARPEGLGLAPGRAASPRPKAFRPAGTRLQTLVEEFVRSLPTDFGTIGVAVKNLRTGETAEYNADHVFEAASLYKLGVMLGVFDAVESGELDLDDPMVIPDWAVSSSDWSVYYAGDVVTGWEALEAMITLSDNPTALVFMEVLGVDRINRVLGRYGLDSTHVDWWEPTTTPADVLKIFELIDAGRAVSPQASEQMRQILLRQRDNRRIPAGLPPNVPVAHKTGSLPGIAHDAGIIYLPAGPVILVAMTADLSDYAAGEEAIAGLASLVADYFAGRS